MKWKITKDHLADQDDKLGEPSRVGYGNYKGNAEDLPIFFKLFDDDGILYYEGRCDEEDFAPLDWAMADAGATEMQTSKDGETFDTL